MTTGRGYFYEGQDIWLTAQVYSPLNALLTSSMVTGSDSVTINVYDLSSATPATAIATGTVLLSNALLTPAQTTGVGWDWDSTGANFRVILYDHDLTHTNGIVVWPVASAPRATGGHVYKVEATFPTTSYGLAALTWELSCKALLSQ